MQMGYWVRAFRLLVACVFIHVSTVPVFGSVHTYDVSGDNGIDDEDGRPSYDGGGTEFLGTGQNGHHGGHAKQITDRNGRLRRNGWHAGSLELTLAVVGDERNPQITVEGTAVAPENTGRSRVTDRHRLDTNFNFRARGGAGGNGGRGGRGQDGARGYNGQDATQYSAGTDGGTGGRGGDEGDSTDGGDAGNGGEITLRVSIRDTDLAMTFGEINVAGNNGGNRGIGRGAGEGGAGGSGGSSYHWTTTKPVQRTRIVSKSDTSTDSEGNVTTNTWTESEDYWENEVEHHSMPGGNNGSRGWDGNRSTVVTRDGRNSRTGQFAFEVVDERGQVRSYNSPYDLKLLPNYALLGSHNSNGFFEPGETISIQGITVVNSGGSPTPKYQKVRVYISDSSRWIRTNEIELTLPEVLEPGETHTFTDAISFHLAELTRREAGRLRSDDVVAPRSRVTRVERDFRNFSANSASTIKVQYPIEITPLDTLVTLAPGEVARAFFRVKNISKQTIGRMPELEDARNAHTLLRRVGGDTDLSAFVMVQTTDSDAVDPAQGIARAIEGLKPGEERIIETLIGLQSNAAHYTHVDLQPELFLESILEPGQVRRVQFEPFELRVAQTFEYSPNSRALLIANNGLDHNVLAAMRAVFQASKIQMDIWDFSYYGFFNFSANVQDYENIFNAYRGKTIFILGNEAQTSAGRVRAQNTLSPNQVIEAARRYGIKIVVIDTSGKPEETLARMIEPLPLPADADESAFRGFNDSRHYLRELSGLLHRTQEDQGDVTVHLGADRMPVWQTRLWGQPQVSALGRAAERTLGDTQSLIPETQLFSDVRFAPVRDGRTWGIFPRWRLGDIDILRSVDDARTSFVAFPIEARRLEDPSFILSPEFQAVINFGQNFAPKMQLLNEILLGEYTEYVRGLPRTPGVRILEAQQYADLMIETILMDLIHEQIAIRPSAFRNRFKKAELFDKLDLLRYFTQFDYSQFRLQPTTPEGASFVRLIATMKFFSRATLSFLDRIPFLSSKNREVSEVTEEMLERLINTVFSDPDQARTLVAAGAEELRQNFRKSGQSQAQLADFLDRFGYRKHSVRDSQLYADTAHRVRLPDRQVEMLRAEQARAEHAERVRLATLAQAAEQKLSAPECERILKNARSVVPTNPVGEPVSTATTVAAAAASDPSVAPRAARSVPETVGVGGARTEAVAGTTRRASRPRRPK